MDFILNSLLMLTATHLIIAVMTDFITANFRCEEIILDAI